MLSVAAGNMRSGMRTSQGPKTKTMKRTQGVILGLAGSAWGCTCPSEWAWSDRKKMAELKEPEARYLVAREASPSSGSQGPIIAFAHFRFELEGLYTVLYVYELQIAESAQKHGLGRRFMQLLELIGVKQGMQWVMLTVFKGNDGAGSFYERLKYELDEIDPSLSEESAMDAPAP